MTFGRLLALLAVLVGLTGAVIGGRALAGSYRLGSASVRRRAFVAILAGLVGLALGALVVARADGGIGTGNGIAGANVAMVVGVIATILGGLAGSRPSPTKTAADRCRKRGTFRP
jgi:hypothetical protein